MRQEVGGRRQEAGRQEAGGRRQEAGGRSRQSGNSRPWSYRWYYTSTGTSTVFHS